MLTCIDVKFIFESVRLGLSSSANRDFKIQRGDGDKNVA